MKGTTRDYSKCCNSPILCDQGPRRLYCHACYDTIPGFGLGDRCALLSKLVFRKDWGRIDLVFRGRGLAYVRDTPWFTWSESVNRYVRHAGGFKWFVQGDVYAEYFGLVQCSCQLGFSTKRAAFVGFRQMLTWKLRPLDVTEIPIEETMGRPPQVIQPQPPAGYEPHVENDFVKGKFWNGMALWMPSARKPRWASRVTRRGGKWVWV